jgi:hypothetical protein
MAVVAAVAAATRAERLRDPLFANVAIGAVAVVYLADAAGGLGFVPGLLTAFPLAIGGVIAWRTGGLPGAVIGVALATLPLVYAFQYLGGAAPQWGGRYTLASGVLLGIVALVVLPGRSPLVLSRLVLLSVLVTLLGVAWLVERSHGADRFFDELLEVAEPVVIARQAFLLREAGPELLDRRWLSVENEREFGAAVDVARMVGEERFTVLEWEGEAPPDEALPTDVREVGRASLRFVNTQVGVVTYEFVEP